MTPHPSRNATASRTGTIAPIFVGGAGRTGTSALGHILAVHPEVFYYGEPRLLVDPGGVNDFLDGGISRENLRDNILRHFLPLIRKSCYRMPGHVAAAFDDDRVTAIFDRAFSDHAGRSEAAAARFVADLFDIGVATAARRRWAHKTPHTIVIADRLHRMFPRMIYIHMIRDPRDVAASTIEQTWGPTSVGSFIPYWLDLMSRADRARRVAPADRYLVLSLRRLAADPIGFIERVYDACGLSTTPDLICSAASTFDAGNANVGRFERTLSGAEEKAILDACGPVYEHWRALEAECFDSPRAAGSNGRRVVNPTSQPHRQPREHTTPDSCSGEFARADNERCGVLHVASTSDAKGATLRIAIIGLGNMGTALAGAFLARGHCVLAIDTDRRKIAALQHGKTPSSEHGADEVFARALARSRLSAVTSLDDLSGIDIVFIAVQTPAVENQCDYTALRVVLDALNGKLADSTALVVASTLFPGAIREHCLPRIARGVTFAYQPVFLRAGHGIDDYLDPGKLTVGVAEPQTPPRTLVSFFHSLTKAAPTFTSYEEAEWIKLVHNAFMSAKIAFANEIGALCDTNGVDAARVIELTFHETPAGRLLTPSHMTPGPPYAGPCLPKDAAVLQGFLEASPAYDAWLAHGVTTALRESNRRHRQELIERWLAAGRRTGGPLGIVGLAFRPGTNELRGSLALDFLRAAELAGFEWLGYDPAMAGISRDAYLLACRQDESLERLFEGVRTPLEEVWRHCPVILINRLLDDGERATVAATPAQPVLVDLYRNDLASTELPPLPTPATTRRPVRKPPEPVDSIA